MTESSLGLEAMLTHGSSIINHELGHGFDLDRKKGSHTTRKWTPEEDEQMINLVKLHGTKHWGNIGKQLKDRTGKQCRERWHNQLDPTINKNPWTAEEEALLIRLHNEKGNKWADIAKHIPGRTDNTIKNHWNSAKRRLNRQTAGKSGGSEKVTGTLGELDLHLRGTIDTGPPRRALTKKLISSNNSSGTTASEETIEESSNALLFMQASPIAAQGDPLSELSRNNHRLPFPMSGLEHQSPYPLPTPGTTASVVNDTKFFPHGPSSGINVSSDLLGGPVGPVGTLSRCSSPRSTISSSFALSPTKSSVDSRVLRANKRTSSAMLNGPGSSGPISESFSNSPRSVLERDERVIKEALGISKRESANLLLGLISPSPSAGNKAAPAFFPESDSHSNDSSSDRDSHLASTGIASMKRPKRADSNSVSSDSDNGTGPDKLNEAGMDINGLDVPVQLQSVNSNVFYTSSAKAVSVSPETVEKRQPAHWADSNSVQVLKAGVRGKLRRSVIAIDSSVDNTPAVTNTTDNAMHTAKSAAQSSGKPSSLTLTLPVSVPLSTRRSSRKITPAKKEDKAMLKKGYNKDNDKQLAIEAPATPGPGPVVFGKTLGSPTTPGSVGSKRGRPPLSINAEAANVGFQIAVEKAVQKVSFLHEADAELRTKTLSTDEADNIGASSATLVNGHAITTGSTSKPIRKRSLSALAEVSSVFTGPLSDRTPRSVKSSDEAFAVYMESKGAGYREF